MLRSKMRLIPFTLVTLLPTTSMAFVPTGHGILASSPSSHFKEKIRSQRGCGRSSMRQTFTHAQTQNVKPGSSLMMSINNNGESDANDSTASDDVSFASILPVVIPLLLVYISNQWSRASLYYLVDFTNTDTVNAAFTAMNQDIGFSEAQYGALASVAFTALFAITSLFAGGLADRYDRKLLTVGSACVWSLATFITASSIEYEQVLAARVLMGLACAFTTTSGYTLIRDLVPTNRASLANSMYGSGVYLGGGLSSLSILLDNRIGWRGTMDFIAAFGIFAAVLSAISIKGDPKMLGESKSKADDVVIDVTKDATSASSMDTSKDEKSALSDVSDILSIPRVQWLFAGSFLRFCSGLCIGVWAAPYYKLAFPDDAASYAVINAIIVGLCGVTSGLIGGYAADKTAAVAEQTGWESNAGRLMVPIVGSLLAVPTWWLTAHASTFDSAIFWLAIEYLVAECWFGPTVAVLQSEVGARQGGVAQGLFTLTGAIGNLAPSLLGIIYGQQIIGDVSNSSVLSNLLANGVCAGYLLSAVCFAVSASQDSRDKKILVKEA